MFIKIFIALLYATKILGYLTISYYAAVDYLIPILANKPELIQRISKELVIWIVVVALAEAFHNVIGFARVRKEMFK